MKYLLSLLIFSISFSSFAQIDTIKIYNCKEYKKGFYKNYNEFITNSPSITYDFTITNLSKDTNDTLDTRVDYTLLDSSKHTGRVWGFCDGKDVYVKHNNTTVTSTFLKLHIGRCSFFSYRDRSSSPVVLLPGLGLVGAVVAAATAGGAIATASTPYSSRDYSLCIITDEGKFIKGPHASDIKKSLSAQPELLKSFEEDARELEKYLNQTYRNDDPENIKFEIYIGLKLLLFRLNENYKNNISK